MGESIRSKVVRYIVKAVSHTADTMIFLLSALPRRTQRIDEDTRNPELVEGTVELLARVRIEVLPSPYVQRRYFVG